MVERWLEGSLFRFLGGQLQPQEILTQLARALEDHSRDGIAPDRLAVFLNPADRRALLAAEPALAALLEDELLGLAGHMGLELRSKPTVSLQPDERLPRQNVRVEADFRPQVEERTQALDLNAVREQAQGSPDGSTYLIIEGQRHLPLTRPIYTLGRRLDCDVVLSDARVSRRHAQLRWRFGRYMLYDLGSSSGTTVNGHPVTESVLEPGDVFSLGGVDIIYGQDIEEKRSHTPGDTTATWRPPAQAEQ